MKEFSYNARDRQGQLVRGTMSAQTAKAVAAKIESLGYLPVKIEESVGQLRLSEPFWERFIKVGFSEINFFTRQLYTLQRAGLPLLGSLNAIKAQTVNVILRKCIEQIVRDIEAGSTLSEAMGRHGTIFNPLYVNMIKTGEISGRLPEILNRLAMLGESEEKTQLRLKSAVRYPAIVVFSIMAGFFALITFVVPRYISIYGQFKADLPLPTKILIFIHYVLSHYWIALLIGLVLSTFTIARLLQTSRGIRFRDSFCLKIPIFGPLILKMIISRFCRIVSILMKSGVPILQILELARQAVGNVVMADVIATISTSVVEGKGMLEPMRNSGFFPPIVLQMVSVGEETAKLDELLLHVADYYDSQIEFTIDNLVSLIEPILILVLGLAVLFMALAIFLPMWDLMKLFQH